MNDGGGGGGVISLSKVFMQSSISLEYCFLSLHVQIRIGCKMHNVDKCACTKAF